MESSSTPISHEPRRRRRSPLRRWSSRIAAALLICLFFLLLAALLIDIDYAYTPPMHKVANPQRINNDIVADFWGQPITAAQAEKLRANPDTRHMLDPAHGAVLIDGDFLELGRRAFYEETFNNEIFATEIAGILDGPLTLWEFNKALLKLRGRGTDNLQIRIAYDAVIGGRQFRKGELVDTGLDVVPGTVVPLGMKMRWNRGRVMAGITCAACHSHVDMETGLVVEGAPNANLNIGLLLAMSSNSAAYFSNTDAHPLQQAVSADPDDYVITRHGEQVHLPDAQAFEDYVDRIFLSWPPGYFDSTIDLRANPSQIPDSFTWRDHPYGWTGFASAGPFNGLSTLNNNVHALNSDGISHAEAAETILGLDPELLLAVALRNAPSERFRWQPGSDQPPSAFFAENDPTPGVPGVNHMVKTPTFPKGSTISPDGLFLSLPGSTVWKRVNAISAFENTLQAAPAPIEFDQVMLDRGREVFVAADCHSCHSGAGLTNHQILPRAQVGASPKRALGNDTSWPNMVFPASTWSWDTPVPVPEDAKVLEVPQDDPMEQVRLAHAQDPAAEGGYKVKGLIGLWWSPPYLHDGGVAVGPDGEAGVPDTLLRAIKPDPVNSLRALLDRELRAPVIAANRASEALQRTGITGEGHEHWVDAPAGFSADDQAALIHYLLSLQSPETAADAAATSDD